MRKMVGSAGRKTPRWIVAGLAVALMSAPAFAGSAGHFTQQQATQGKNVYNGNCSQCHGSRLQGGAGPALHGTKFQKSMKFGNYDASGLYDFISTHMPKTNPGGLSQKQYLEVFSYILSRNGFSAGGKPLDKNSIGKIKLLPLPSSGKG